MDSGFFIHDSVPEPLGGTHHGVGSLGTRLCAVLFFVKKKNRAKFRMNFLKFMKKKTI